MLATNKPIAEEHFRAIPEVETAMHIDLRFTIQVRATTSEWRAPGCRDVRASDRTHSDVECF